LLIAEPQRVNDSVVPPWDGAVGYRQPFGAIAAAPKRNQGLFVIMVKER
jgi:hypothetical protein